ncbi:MAG TPA: DUF72 domain-containing protein [Candidatus Saccharimonadales bacterium]|nr:DUF72 domain-containing protein [Candidatus Saccharimonadales bacterium]
MSGHLFAGTSGFAYPRWTPLFYPAGIRAEAFLSYYAGRFPACELNNTWYQTPSRSKITGWLAATPPNFRFSVKGQRGASLRTLLKGPDESLPFLTDPIRQFGERLGTVLFRVPKEIPRDDNRLAALLARWPVDLPLTMEFQDASWLVDEVIDACRASGAAVCATELDENEEPPRLWVTAGWLYLRLRRSRYDRNEIEAWANRIVPFLEIGQDVYVFFRHDATGEATVRAAALTEAVERRMGVPPGEL